MRDVFHEKTNKYESGSDKGSFDINGTLWMFYYKKDKMKYYFDSYGKQIDKPIKELINYIGKL